MNATPNDTDCNLARRADAQLTVSTPTPRGNGARDVRVLLNDRIAGLHRQPVSEFERHLTYDTYDGHNVATGPDWYALELTEAATFNYIEMTMGFPNHNGGWWRSLHVEHFDEAVGEWRAVENLHITPPYNFSETRVGRLPYESHALIFDAVRARQVRLIGQPGGSAEFTSLARLALYERDLTRWNPAALPSTPIPITFQLIAPQIICDFSENFVKLAGLTIDFPLVEFYVDQPRFLRFYAARDESSGGQISLWGILGETVGWADWDSSADAVKLGSSAPGASMLRSGAAREPYVQLSFHNMRASAVAPLVVDGVVQGEMRTHFALLSDSFDRGWHERFARDHGIRWQEYALALDAAPRKSMRQLEGAAAILGLFANQIANLAHRNAELQRELEDAQRQTQAQPASPKELVRAAVAYMQENLEEPVTVSGVAAALAVSPTYLGVLIKEHTGRTPSEHLIDLRLARAKEYLAAGTLSVLDICVALGYTPSYFSRLFKQRTGLSPSEFAARMRPPQGQ